MDYFLLVASVSLVFQVAVFVLLLGGWTLKRMRRFRAHGVFMLVGVVMHLVVIFGLMVPSFVEAFVPLIVSVPLGLNSVLSAVHSGLGVVAAALGVWLVAGWRLRRSLEFCVPKKRWMRWTFFVWIGALMLGFVLYLSLFWSSLLG
jgi:uncharacterized membrane protein YozB (DUF420 family)